MKKQKGFVGLFLAIVVAVIVLAGGAYLVMLPKSPPPIFQDQPDTTVNTQTNTNTNVNTNNSTTGWKTYTNAQYGFEFKYPSSYVLSENRAGITIATTSACLNLAEGGTWPKACSSYNLLIQKNKISVEGFGVVKTATKVAGYSGERIEMNDAGMWEDSNQTLVQFSKDNNWYISNMSFNSQNKVAAENLLTQILSTFKFTQSTSATKTITINGLAIKIPQSWQFRAPTTSNDNCRSIHCQTSEAGNGSSSYKIFDPSVTTAAELNDKNAIYISTWDCFDGSAIPCPVIPFTGDPSLSWSYYSLTFQTYGTNPQTVNMFKQIIDQVSKLPIKQ